MFVRDVLLPRAILVNAALYAIVALLYTIIFFALETISPGKYVFSNSSNLRTVFRYLVICSWPVLLFGALILIAVRVGGNVRRRRRRSKRSKKSKEKPESDDIDTKRKQPPSTVPPPQPDSSSPIPRYSSHSLPEKSDNDRSFVRNTSAAPSKPSSGASKRPRVKKGYVSVSPSQRIFATLGFLWVSVGLACSAAAAVIVFLGQRERYHEQAAELGRESEEWKSWVIPIFCGILMAVVFTILSVTTLLKVISTAAAKGREIETPANSENAGSQEDLDEEDMLFVDGEPTAPPLTPAASQAQPNQPTRPPPAVRGRVRMGNNGYNAPRQLPCEPDQKTVDRLMRQLRDLGFPNPHQNLAALQASSFDLERASEKLMNAQVV